MNSYQEIMKQAVKLLQTFSQEAPDHGLSVSLAIYGALVNINGAWYAANADETVGVDKIPGNHTIEVRQNGVIVMLYDEYDVLRNNHVDGGQIKHYILSSLNI